MEETELSIINRSQDIIGGLGSIANIKFGEYWNTTTNSPQKSNIITSIIRTIWYTNEGRCMTLTYVSTLIDKAFYLLDDIYEELKRVSDKPIKCKKYNNLAKKIKVSILNSQSGIINLKGVYHKDEKIKSDIDLLIKSIKDRYLDYQQMLPDNETPYKSPEEYIKN